METSLRVPLNHLRERAAGLLSVGFDGTVLSPSLRKLLDAGVGGVILFSRNIESAQQVAKLIESIKSYAARPLLVGLDQEGGVVQRLKVGFTRVPPMRLLGQIGDTALARRVGLLLGEELRAVGVDVNFAPVVDVDTNPNNPVIGDRSFGRDPDAVARLGLALGQGLEAAGVASCAKHFPGHGDTLQDSHLHLPRLDHSLARLEAVELRPFRLWAQENMASVMSAHVVFRALDEEYPATLSRPVLHGLLREQLGYKGLIFSDDMEMKAIAEHFGYKQAAVRGLNAGVDHFLCCHSFDVAMLFIDALSEGVLNGSIEEARFEDACRRGENFQRSWVRPPGTLDSARLFSPSSRDTMSELQKRGAEQEPKRSDPTEVMTELVKK